MKYKSLILLVICFIINSSLSLYESQKIKDTGNETLTELYPKVNSAYMKDVIDYLTELIDSYVFFDILQNPPNPYEDLKVDIKELLNNIKVEEDKPFYEFYRDIRKTLSFAYDSVLDIAGGIIPFDERRVIFSNYHICLPFKFYLDKREKDTIQIYIKEYEKCSKYYDENIRTFIKAHESITLEKINEENPFNYIQKFGNDFYKFKNPDSYFNFILERINDFYLTYIPLLPEEINSLNLTFGNNDTLETHFYLNKSDDSGVNDEFINNAMTKENEEIKWDYETDNKYFKCRIDEKNKINVFVITSFDMELKDFKILGKCGKLFVTNKYPIIGIESQNVKGSNLFSYALTQIIQPKIDFQFKAAMRQSELNKNFFEKNRLQFLNSETCLPFENWDDFIESNPDKYGNIEHKRTKLFNLIPKDIKNDIEQLKKSMKNNGYFRKPTDILILTDTVSYGSGSLFIKNLQNTGGAIIASYGGNPLYKENKYDASLDASDLHNFVDTELYTKLANKGFIINKIPFVEIFSSNDNSKIPMAFQVNKIDEKTNIYHSYEDIHYIEFINEGINILNKYNKELKCNNENLNLVYEDDNCTFSEDEHAHGGLVCSNGIWGKTCKKFYCDFGYYYNKEKDKCEINRCIDEYININQEEEKFYDIEPNKTYIFQMNGNLYGYEFKSPIDDIINYPTLEKCPKYCLVKNKNINEMYVNYFHNLTEKIQIKVTYFENNFNIKSIIVDSPKESFIGPYSNFVQVYQFTEDNYLYAESYDSFFPVYHGLYEEGMTVMDIRTLNLKYFKPIDKKINILEKNSIHIIVVRPVYNFYNAKVYIFNSLPNQMSIENLNMPLLYLKNENIYELDFSNNDIPFIIKLNPIEKAKIEITEINTNNSNTKIISSTDKYFKPSIDIYKGKIKLKVSEENGLIEILYSLGDNNTKLLNDIKGGEHIVSEKVIMVEYPSNIDKKVQISIESKARFGLYFYPGLTINTYFYYTYSSINNLNKYVITLDNPIKDINLETNEKYYLSLIPYSTTQGQIIKITYQYFYNPIEALYEKLDETYAQNVISNLSSIIDNYIYIDIAKNPPTENFPKGYHHAPIDIISNLKSINITNMNFYDFYRKIRRIFGTVRDPHLGIYSIVSPKGNNINYMTACLPFSFYVEKDEQGIPKIYIKYYSDCATYFDDKVKNTVQEMINNHSPLKSINGDDPFDYIQKWGIEYNGYKSPHAHFTYMKTCIYSFPINFFPYKPEELKLILEFEDGNELNIEYHILIDNIQNLQMLYGSNDFNKEDFDEFIKEEEEKQNKDNNLNEMNLFELMKKYKIKKGKIKEETKLLSAIQWDYRTQEENGIRCKVDEVRKINVIVQENFNLKYDSAIDVMKKCVSAFYQNDYKIIIIENLNGGGSGRLALIFNQLIQIKIQNRVYMATNQKTDIKNIFRDSWLTTFTEFETCKFFNYYDFDKAFDGITNDYSSINETILHKKSKFMDWLNKEDRKKLKDAREELYKYGKLKKPTDIILFTDSYSFSATSIFIKSFQNTGGAILVGYNGNPKIGKEYFDASQSASSVIDFSFTQTYKNLISMGWKVGGITYLEEFDDDYRSNKSIPREYLLDPVDEIVDIYEPYTDDKYESFIEEAEIIFDKYNYKNQCNPNNTNLLFDTNNCYNFSDEKIAHGGYTCGVDGNWNNTNCKKYYCDIGYYYNKIEDKCIRDICANDPGEINIDLTGEFSENITINKNNNTEYVFNIKNKEYIYFFEASERGYLHYKANNPCINLCSLQYVEGNDNRMYINYYRNITNDNKEIIIKIYSVPNLNVDIYSSELKGDFKTEFKYYLKKTVRINEATIDYITYIQLYDESAKSYIAEYKEEMSANDILNKTSKYFKDCTNDIVNMKAGKTYIIVILSEINGKIFHLFQQPKIGDKIINIPNSIDIFPRYLSKESGEVTLNFKNNKFNVMLQLSKATLNSEILFKNLDTGNEIIVGPNNHYYTFDNTSNIFTGQITMKITKGEGAMIELLYEYNKNDYDIINEKEFREYKINKPTIIKFDNNYKNKNIKLTMKSKTGKEFGYSLLSGHSKNNYMIYPTRISPFVNGELSYDINIYNKKEILEKDESFYVVIYVDNNILSNDFYYITLTKEDIISIDDFNMEIQESKCEQVKTNLINLIKYGYVYTDILKNPPNSLHLDKYDIIENLNNLNTKNRKYYDFYRDIRNITSKTKDNNLNILAHYSPNEHNLKMMAFCLPFSFYVKDKNKIHIKKYEDCFKFYTEEDRNLINNVLDKQLIKINDEDPFIFIQNIQKYNTLHSPQAQFSTNLENAHFLLINFNPYKEEELSNNKFKFEEKEITLSYHLYSPEPDILYNKEFIDFFDKEIENKINPSEMNIINIEKKYKKQKNNLIQGKSATSTINWKYATQKEKGIKCIIDTTNQVNVLVQYSFDFFEDKDYNDALNIIDKCLNEFYDNEYPIIVIESNNGGGNIELALYLQQFLQVKIAQKTFFSVKISDLIKKEFEKDMSNKISIDTCKQFDNFDKLKQINDKYENEGIHTRTEVFQIYNSTIYKQHEERRKKYFEQNKFKKPTEIIIFTDSYSSGAASFLIKGLQETGGAIIVGYKGNQNSQDAFEASHSTSTVSKFKDSDITKNLSESGFDVLGVTYYESFNYDYQKENPIPREFLTNPVDEIVPIFEKYDDSFYEDFIREGKAIFSNYNNNTCNKNNLLLVKDPNNKQDCYKFVGDEFAHGGYMCNNQTGTWSNECRAYYCDIGYYFDTYKKKCIKDVCTNNDGKGSDDKKGGDGGGLKAWHIVLISLGSVLVLFILLLIIRKFVIRKKKDDINNIAGPLIGKNDENMKELSDKN